MEEKATLIETLVDKARDYTDSSIDLFKLKTIDKSAKMLSSLVSTLILTISALCFITMLNIGAGFWLGALVGNTFYGFFIVAAFYLLLTLILYAFRKDILKTPVSNTIIKHFREEMNV